MFLIYFIKLKNKIKNALAGLGVFKDTSKETIAHFLMSKN
jgi:hypothetical protein